MLSTDVTKMYQLVAFTMRHAFVKLCQFQISSFITFYSDRQTDTCFIANDDDIMCEFFLLLVNLTMLQSSCSGCFGLLNDETSVGV